MQFKVGDKVKVMRKSIKRQEVHWNPLMNRTIGKIYTILEISYSGNLRLDTESDATHNWLFPPKGVENIAIKNQQLLFEFMNES